MLERLTPVERAAFLLREVFDYAYDEIAAIIGKSEASVPPDRAARARRHVDAERAALRGRREAHEELTDRFLAAARTATRRARELLAEDVDAYTDGGGKAQAPRAPGPRPGARRALHGRHQPPRPRRRLGHAAVVLVNGVPGRLARDADGNAVAVLTLDVADGLGHRRAHRRQPRKAHAPAGVVTRDAAERTLARLHEAQASFYAGGPREPLHEVLTDDIVWLVPGRNAIAGEYRGPDAVIDYFARRRAIADRSLRMHPGECSSATATTPPSSPTAPRRSTASSTAGRPSGSTGCATTASRRAGCWR